MVCRCGGALLPFVIQRSSFIFCVMPPSPTQVPRLQEKWKRMWGRHINYLSFYITPVISSHFLLPQNPSHGLTLMQGLLEMYFLAGQLVPGKNFIFLARSTNLWCTAGCLCHNPLEWFYNHLVLWDWSWDYCECLEIGWGNYSLSLLGLNFGPF